MSSSEPILHRQSLLLLVLCFVPCYLVNIWVVELRRDEALIGTVAREMAQSGDVLTTTFQGDHVSIFPQYPALVALCSGMGISSTCTTRLPGGLAVLATALVCAAFASRRGGRVAGIVAGGMVLSTLASLRAGQRAQSETLLMFWLTCGWLAWFVYGQERKRWGLAWGSAMLFLFLATSAVGARAMVYFYIPFLFLKRPVRGRQRLLQPYHLVAFGGLVVMVAFWLHAVPNQPFMPWNAEHTRAAHRTGYLLNRLLFPAKTAMYLMPWMALGWTPFCVAFRSVEDRPVLFHYLRTIAASVFLFVWLVPWTSPLLLLPVLPALSIMTGCHFEILLRRHARELEQFLAGIAWLGGGGAFLALSLCVCHMGGVVLLDGLPAGVAAWNAGVLAAAGTLAFVAIRSRRRGMAYWLRFLLAVCSLRLVVAAVLPPWEAWRGNERRQVGRVLGGHMEPELLHGGHGPSGDDANRPDLPELRLLQRAAPTDGREIEKTEEASPALPASMVRPLPPDVPVVFVHRPAEKDGASEASRPALITESFYLGRYVCRVREIESELPRDAATVYVLGGRHAPVTASRIWTPASPVMDSRRRNTLAFDWLPGDYCVLRLRVLPRPMPHDYIPNWVRLYRGDAR